MSKEKQQVSIQASEKTRDRFDAFVSDNKSIFGRQGTQSKAGEAVLIAGLDVCEPLYAAERKKLKNKKND